MMKKIWCLALFSMITICGAVEDQFDEEGYIIEAQQKQKTSVVVVVCGKKIDYLIDIYRIIKRDLEFTDQFMLAHAQQESAFKKEEDFWIYKGQGSFLIALNMSQEDENVVQWRLYTLDKDGKGKFIKGEEITPLSDKDQTPFLFSATDRFSWWVHTISHDLYKELTGEISPFLSKIAYCKQLFDSMSANYVCVADYDGSNEVMVVPGKNAKGKQIKSQTTYIAPCWTVEKSTPQLLYSEYTALNMRLMMTDFVNTPVIVTDFNGSNMLPTFSSDGKQALICLSAQGKTDIYRYVPGKKGKGGKYLKLSQNKGRNLSPAILNDGQIIFCSDYELNIPHIYMMDRNGNGVKRLSESNGKVRSSATSPSYSPTKNKIAYVQEINGTFQLMIYDLITSKSEQVSSDSRQKGNPSWSPCGNYILCSIYDGSNKQLACYKLLTSTWQTMRPSSYDMLEVDEDFSSYTFPAWSSFLETSSIVS